MAKIYKFTAVVENAITRMSIDASDAACRGSKEAASDAEEKVEWAIEMLTASRQQEIYIRYLSKEKWYFRKRNDRQLTWFLMQSCRRKLLNDVERSENAVKNLMERLQARLFKLHDTVRYRTAIPTTQVYVNTTAWKDKS